MRPPLPGALLLAGLALAACGPPAPPPEAEAPPPSVTVAPVETTQLPDERERVGQVHAVSDVELRARIEGFLEQRLFEEGSDVEAGDLLFVIERAPYEARVARAEADLARAQAELEVAGLELRRTRQLRKRGVESQASLDEVVATEARGAAEVLAAEATLREARLDLAYTEIRAPFSGRIGRAAYDPGDLVGPESEPLATITSLDPIHVYWQAPEGAILDFRRTSAERARRGEEPLAVTARLRFGDGTVYAHVGEWNFLDNRVDPRTGTQTARAVFPNPDGILLPGQYATVRIQVGDPRNALVIPQQAVQEDQAGRFVLVVDDEGIVELRRVVLGVRYGIHWEVKSGLEPGERVIYQGIQKAQPGARVSAMERAPEPPVRVPPAGDAPAG